MQRVRATTAFIGLFRVLTDDPGRRHRWRVLLAMVAIASTLTVIGQATPVSAADEGFSARFTANTTGSIQFAANTLLTCPASASCTTAQNGTGNTANNQFSMIDVDVDTDPTTDNSSSAELTIPSGATVLFAGLYWGARSSRNDRDEVLFDTPATPGYVYSTVSAAKLYSTGRTYQGFADVTATVSAAGAGLYTLADVATETGGGRHAGWSLVVVLDDPAEPFRSLTVFDGWNQIRSNETEDITVSGFLAPPTGPVNAEIGLIAYEGDNRYSGDYAQLNGVNLSDAANPSRNFFNSRISTGGVVATGNDPSYVDQLGFDANIVHTTGLVSPSATSATVTVGTAGDWYYQGVITSAIDIFVPDLVTNLTKTVTDSNGAPTNPDDTLVYEVAFSNVADDAARDVVLTDVIPTGLTYVPGSLEVVSGDNPGAKTDAADGDTGTVTGNTVTVNLGTGADGSDGGRVAANSSEYRVRFRATVDSGTEDTSITNTAEVAYTGETTGDAYDGSTAVEVDVKPLADLRLLSKSDDIDPAVAGAAGVLTYTLQVVNNGPSPAENVTATDTLPDGVTYVDGSSDPACDESSPGSGVVICNLGTMAAGASSPITIGVTVDETTETGQLANTASVATTTPDLSPMDDQASEQTTVSRSSDLGLTKVATPTPNSSGDAVAGGQISYLLTVSNSGPSSATDVSLVDALPAGTSFVSATPSGGGSCTQPGAIRCTWATISAGDSRTAVVVVAIDPDADAGTLTNTATVDHAEDDPTPADNRATESIGVVREIDLVTTKTHVGSPVPGQDLLYSLTVTNNGPSSARATDLVDDLPSQVTFKPAVSSAGCLLSTAPSEVTCDLGTIQPGDTVDVVIGATIPPGQADGVELVNTASASADEGASPNAQDRADTERQVDLSVVKSGDVDPVAAGSTLTYTLTVGNDGPSNSDGATVVDTLPAGLTFLPGSSDGRCAAAGSTVTCTGIDVDAGSVESIVIAATVPAGATPGSALANTASATPGAGETDTNPANDTGATTTQVERTSELQVTKSDSVDPVTAGETMSWTVSVVNHGPSTDDNVTLTDVLPTGVRFVSATGPCDETTPGSGVVSCAFGTLNVAPAANSSASTTITVSVDADLVAGTVLANSATADGDASSPTVGTEQTTVAAVANLALAKSAPASAIVGQPYDYVVTVTNNGPSDATGVVVTDILPPELTTSSYVVNSGFASCSGTPLRCVPGSTAADGVVSVGDSVTMTITVDSAPDTADGVTLTNRALATANQPDPDASDNEASAATSANRSADLSITKSNAGGDTPAGGVLTYDVTVDNLGPSVASNVTITDPVPSGLTFDAAASSAGCAYTAPDVTCTVDTLDPSDPAATFSLVFDVSPGIGNTTISNTATVAGAETDPAAANNSATDATNIYPEADLALTKTSATTAIVPGTTHRYDLTVTNSGPSNAVATVVTDTLPAGTSLNTDLSDSRCVAGTGQAVICSLATVPPAPAAGSTDTFAIVVSVDADVTAPTLTNTAVVSSDTPDPTPSDNTDTAVVSAVAQADLALTKTASADPVEAGEQLSFTLSVTNAGPSDAPSTTVTDTLPDGFTFQSAGSDARCSALEQVVTCSEPTPLAPSDGPRTFVVAVTVDPSFTDGLAARNRAAVSSPADDTDRTDNEATASVTVVRRSDLTIDKSTSTTSAVAGDQVSFVLTVTNNGPSDASGVEIADTLPSDVSPITIAPSGVVSCNLDGQDVSCGGPTLAAGESFLVTVEATVDPATANNSTPLNTASVSGVETDPVSGNNSDVASFGVVRQSDLKVTKTSGAQPTATAGATHVFEIEVANVGLSDNSNVVAVDTLPPGTTFYPALSSGSCSEPTPGTVSCAVGTLPAGAVANLVVAVEIDASIADGSSLTNSVTVSGDDTDIQPANNTDSVTIDVERTADLAIIKQGPTSPANAGDQVQFTLSVDNLGPSQATAVTAIDTLPTGLTFVAGAPTDSRCNAIGQVVTCTDSGPLLPTGSTSFVVAATSSASLPDGGTLQNTAAVSAEEQDPVGANNQSQTVTEFSRSADLTVIKVDDADPAVAGEPITYTITALNNGPSVTANAEVTETLPAGTTYNDGLSDSRCDETTPGSGVVTCPIGVLGVGLGNAETVVIVAELDGDLSTGSQLDNQVSLSGDLAPTAAANEETTVVREVDLVMAKTLDTSPVIAGEPVQWTLTIDNNGPSTATEVVVTDILPIGLRAVTTSPGPNSCNVTGAVVLCTFAELDAGDQLTVTVTAEIESWATVGTDITNGAAVTAAETELVAADNQAAAAGGTSRSVDVSIDKTPADPAIAAGENAVWQLTVTNDGPSYASNVIVTDQLPASATFDAAASSPACTETTAGSGAVTCTAATLPDDEQVVFTIAATTPASLAEGQSLVNQASVVVDEPNTSTATVDEATVGVDIAADLSLSKVHVGDGLEAGKTGSYQLTVTNNGPSDATEVLISDVLPSGLAFVSADSDNRCGESAGTVTCTLGDLLTGDEVTVALAVAVDAEATGELVNTAEVSTSTPDHDGDNNRSVAVATVIRRSSYDLTKTGPATAVAGGLVDWRITATNNGPAAGPVTITDHLPDGLDLVSYAAPDGVACVQETGVLTCTTGALLVGTSVVLDIQTRATETGELTNVATLDGDALLVAASADATIDVAPGNLAFTGLTSLWFLHMAMGLLAVGLVLLIIGARHQAGQVSRP